MNYVERCVEPHRECNWLSSKATIPALKARFVNSLEPNTISNEMLKVGLLTASVVVWYLSRLQCASYNSRLYPVVHETWTWRLS